MAARVNTDMDILYSDCYGRGIMVQRGTEHVEALMKTLWMSAVLACMLALASVLPSLAADKGKPPAHGHTEKFKLVVPGDKDWVNTGIDLKPGDTATIMAEGTVYYNNESFSAVTPDGYYWEYYQKDLILDDAAYCYDPGEEERWAHAALIGEVNGEMFYVGPKKVIAGKVGQLYLGINDCTLTSPERFRNSGQFTVVIIVDRHDLKP